MFSKSLVFAEPLKRTAALSVLLDRQKASGTLQAEGVRHTTGRSVQAHYRQKASGILQAEDVRHTTGRRFHAHYKRKSSGALHEQYFRHTTGTILQSHYRNKTSATLQAEDLYALLAEDFRHATGTDFRYTTSIRLQSTTGRGLRYLPSSLIIRGLWRLFFGLLKVPSKGHMQKQFCPTSHRR